MSSRDEVQVWAETEVNDPIFSNPQRATIEPDYWAKGWLREVPVAAQELNQLFYLITDILKNDTLSPALNLSDVDDAAAARTNLGIILTDYLRKDQNLADVPNKATARTNLGLDIDTLYNNFFDRMHPVGTIYTVTGVATNPSTLLGRGTWVAVGQGRTLVGVGTGTDSNSFSKTVTDGQTFGEYQHTMTQAELVRHSHTLTTYDDQETGVPGNDIAGTPITGQSGQRSTDSTGTSTPFNVCQPSLGVYFWKRTA